MGPSHRRLGRRDIGAAGSSACSDTVERAASGGLGGVAAGAVVGGPVGAVVGGATGGTVREKSVDGIDEATD